MSTRRISTLAAQVSNFIFLLICVQPLSKVQVSCLAVDYDFPSRTVDVNFEIDLEVSDNGLVVARENAITLIDLSDDMKSTSLPRDRHVTEFDISLSPDSRYMAEVFSSYPDATPVSLFRVWDLETKKPLYTVDTGSEVVAWSPDGRYIATNQTMGGINIRNATSGEIMTQISWRTNSMAWHPRYPKIALGFEYAETVLVWDVVEEVIDESLVGESITRVIEWFDDNHLMLLVGLSQIILWNTETQQVDHRYETLPFTNIFDAALSPDGTIIAIGTRDGLILWEPILNQVQDFRDNTPPVYRLIWAEDKLILADFDRGLYRFNIKRSCVTAVLDRPLVNQFEN